MAYVRDALGHEGPVMSSKKMTIDGKTVVVLGALLTSVSLRLLLPSNDNFFGGPEDDDLWENLRRLWDHDTPPSSPA